MKKGDRRSAGEGSIRFDQRRNRFVAEIRRGDVRKTHYTEKRYQASEWLADMRRRLDAGLLEHPDAAQTLADFAASWYAGRLKIRRSGTLLTNRSIIRNHLDIIGAMRLDQLTPKMMQDHYTRKLASVSPAWAHTIMATIKTILQHAVDLEIIPKNPAKNVKLEDGPQRQYTTWTTEQASRFLAICQGTNAYMTAAALSLVTGMREGEILGLQWADLDFALMRVHVAHTLHRVNGAYQLEPPKSLTSTRYIPLPAVIVPILGTWQRQQEAERLMMGEAWQNTLRLVFTLPSGMPINAASFLAMFHRQVQRLDLPAIRAHDLRHTYATLLIERGIPIKVVSEWLGHADVAVTMRVYAHVTAKMQANSATEINQIFISEGKSE